MNVLDLLQQRSISPKRAASTKGGEFHSPCPSCGGRDRFHVWPAQNGGEGSYWCRGCNRGGDIIQFLIDFEYMSYGKACQYLDKPTRSPSPTPATRLRQKALIPYSQNPVNPPSALWQEKAARFLNWSHDFLMSSEYHLKLLSDRGLKRASAEKCRLGWNPGKNGKDFYRSREAWGLEAVLKSNGLKKKLWLPVGLVIPLIVDGKVRRIRIRRPEGGPRYYILPGSSAEIMMIRHLKAYVIIESELDLILLDQEVSDIIGLLALGSSSNKPDRATYETLSTAEIILNALDYDKAGAKAVCWWRKNYPQSKRWPVPIGKDPGEAFLQGIDLREWISLGLE